MIALRDGFRSGSARVNAFSKAVASSRGGLRGLLSAQGTPFRLLLALALLLVGTLRVFAQDAAAMPAPANPFLSAANFIVQPYVTIGLLVAGCALLFHDLLTPTTWGVTGTLGVICMGLVFAAFITLGDKGWVGELLLLAGLAAILLEVHVFPGYGSAIIGFVLMFAGMFLSLGGTGNPAFALSITAFLIAVSGLAFLAYLPKSPAWRRLRVQMQHTHLAPTPLATDTTLYTPLTVAVLPGQTGRTITALRPMGEAEFSGVRVPVITEGDFLGPDTPIIVTEVDGDRIVVALVSNTAFQTA